MRLSEAFVNISDDYSDEEVMVAAAMVLELSLGLNPLQLMALQRIVFEPRDAPAIFTGIQPPCEAGHTSIARAFSG